MKSLKPYLITFVLLLALLLHTHSIHAQATDASITGTVKDATNNELLPGATITIRNDATGFETHTITNARGEYALHQLPLGKPYSISASFVGSKP
jgi:hypothetical protein